MNQSKFRTGDTWAGMTTKTRRDRQMPCTSLPSMNLAFLPLLPASWHGSAAAGIQQQQHLRIWGWDSPAACPLLFPGEEEERKKEEEEKEA